MPSALEEKLARAQRGRAATRRKVFRLAAIAVVAALAVASVTRLAVHLERQRAQLQQVEQAAGPAAAPAAAELPPTQNAAAPQSANADNAAAPAAAADDARAQFMLLLSQYESEIESQIAALNLRAWDAGRADQLDELKTRAVEQFAAGEYAAARISLRQAQDLAAEAAAEHARELAAAKNTARAAFAAGRAAEAQAAIRRALLLKPGDAAMAALQKRVAVLPEVLDYLEQAAVARKENRPAKEAAALQKVVALDGQRADAKARLREVRAEIRQQQFTEALGAARAALATGDLAAAEQNLAAAAAVFPAHEALQPLREALQTARDEREFAAQVALGQSAGRRDDWAAAVAHFARARQLKANDADAVAGHNRAQNVLEVGREIGRLLAQKHRLADKRVVDSAAEYLRAPATESAAELSPRLRALHAELARAVAAYLTEVEVVVVSDNATHIIVRGEGVVGATARRVIKLRPGRRVFEGSRRGYQSKLVAVDIAPGSAALEVTVICDEKI